MASGDLRPDELTAAQVLVSQLGDGTVIPRDVPGAPEQTHDFDIEHDRRHIAVEVTSASDHALVSMRAAVGREWNARSLSSDWLVSFDSQVPLQINRTMRRLEPQLAVLEAEGVDEVSTDPGGLEGLSSAAMEAAQQALTGRVNRARRWGPATPGTPARMMLMPHRGLTTHPELVNPLVEKAAEANIEKLLAAEADERHLFVWIDEDAAELAMFTQGPPEATPTLPAGIDVLWAATRGKVPSALCERLWRLAPPGAWERVA